MIQFHIKSPDRTIEAAIREKIDNLTKPKGSLGRLEEFATKICLIQQTLTPELRRPHNVLFAADHGILEEGVSVSPKEVTWQQLSHFSKGGAGINFLCDQHGFRLVLVDAGVDYDIPHGHGIIDMKVRKGTRNFLHEGAMTEEEFDTCLERGAEVVADIATATGCNIISFGEMGSVLQWTFLNFPPFSVFLGTFHFLKCVFLTFRDFQFSPHIPGLTVCTSLFSRF